MNCAQRTRILLFAIILIMLGTSMILSAQATENSTTSSTSTATTWTDNQVRALVADLKLEKNKAIDVAVQTATAPLIADLYTLNLELDFYKSRFRVIVIFGGIGITIIAGLVGYGLAHIF